MASLRSALLAAIGVVVGEFAASDNFIGKLYAKTFLAVDLPALKIKIADDPDGEEHEPASIGYARWFVEALTVLARVCGQEDMAVLDKATKRAQLALDTFRAWSDFAKTSDLTEAIHQWSNIWVRALELGSGGPSLAPTTILPFGGVDSLIRKLEADQDVKTLITHFVLERLGPRSVGCESAIRVCEDKSALLPLDVAQLVSFIGTLDRVAEVASKLEQGKDAGGLLDLALLVAEARKMMAQASGEMVSAKRPDFTRQLAAVADEFQSVLKSQLDKSDCSRALAEFLAEYEKLPRAVDAWNFADCPWIFKDATPAQEALAKRIEQIVTQHSVGMNLLDRVSEAMTWGDDDGRKAVREVLRDMGKERGRVAEAGNMLSMLMLASVVAQGEADKSFDASGPQVQATIRYVQKVLKTPTEELPDALRTKIFAPSAVVGKADSGSRSVAGATATTAADSAAVGKPSKLKKLIQLAA